MKTEEKKHVFFTGEVIYTQEAVKEHQKFVQFFDKKQVTINTIASILLLFLHLFLNIDDYIFLFFSVFVAFRLFYRPSSLIYKRMLSQNEGIPVQNVFEFNHFQILLQQPHNGNHTAFQYTQVIGLAQTPHYFVLLLEHDQYFLLDKTSIGDGVADSFIQFLCNACPKMHPKKMRNNTFGQIIHYSLFVLLLLFALRNLILFLSIFF